ncbi:Probable nicotinate-nucleotide adenylyltransferase [Chlamydiales bacterium SCGC AG-110-M15]|nr:Probable nicotinate-nucleotide adenylyltransferase [Chlamydiales bacterium SCGC AG-110-M15]
MIENDTRNKNIGIFGGTFDPIHFGHLNLAIQMLEGQNLDEIWFCPAQLSPHKLDAQPVSSSHRLRMLEIAIDGFDSFKILDRELKRPPPSYTIDTIEDLLNDEKLKNNHYSLILSDDAVERFHQWHRVKDLVELVPLLLGSRHGQNSLGETNEGTLSQAIQSGLKKTLIMEISSTLLRDRLKKNLYCLHLLPHKVLDYIYENHLYST